MNTNIAQSVDAPAYGVAAAVANDNAIIAQAFDILSRRTRPGRSSISPAWCASS